MLKVTILDGYIDEPACLGVPPYISPYPRYIAGAIYSANKNADILYLTIDQIRNDKNILDQLKKSHIIIVVAGMSVPGRYLSGFPASPNEIVSILSNVKDSIKILAGPAAKHGFGTSGGKKTRFVEGTFDLVIKGDAEIVLYDLLKNNLSVETADSTLRRKNAREIKDFAIKGAQIVQEHPFYPDYLITEIETYRGCTRSIVGGCSFCSEPEKGLPDFRPIDDVVNEIQNLYKFGIRNFRLGNQPCIFSYMAKDAGKEEFPRPNPSALEQLFKKIRLVAPELKTLHIDNANPGIIARFPEECKKIAKTIVKYHTSGDVAAFGVESVDPEVIKKNNLKANAEEVLSAVKLLNDVGARRGRNGMPELLPGLNFLVGLLGETKNTFELNFEFLKEILDQDLLLRRINLRQVIPIPGTKIYREGYRISSKNRSRFRKFKEKVNKEIAQPMLEKMLPKGTILSEVYAEKHNGKLTFGRQIGSYPLLIGIPGKQDLNKFLDVKVVDYGYRSITAIPHPLNINSAARETIEAIPRIGKKRAIRILASRPFESKDALRKALDEQDVADEILKYVTFSK